MTLRAFCLPASVMLALAVQMPMGAEEADASSQELSTKLDAFINSAVDDGILQPKGGALDTVPEAVPGALPVAMAGSSSVSRCGGIGSLLFEDFKNMSTYSDLVGFRDELANHTELTSDQRSLALAHANIAIGLNSEARMALSASEGSAATALVQLSQLLEGHAIEPGDDGFAMDDCLETSRLWRALNFLAQDDPQGLDILREQIPAFRGLPIRIRINVASVAVPALERLDERLLAQRIMAEFTAEEIAATAQLKFSQALLDYSAGQEDALQTVKDFLEQPSVQASAMEVLVDTDALPTMIDGRIPLGRAIEFIAGASNTRDETIRLRVVLDVLMGAGRYSEISELASFPSARMPDKISVVQNELHKKLTADLAAESLQKNFNAINYLASDRSFLKAHPKAEALYGAATNVAADLGYSVLAADLGSAFGADSDAVAVYKAETAYRRGEYEQVVEVALAFPEQAELSYLAGKVAVSERDPQSFARFEGRLFNHPEHLLALLEADALAETWFASSAAYDRIDFTENPELESRFSRLAFLQDDYRNGAPSQTLSLSDAFDAFNASSQPALAPQSGAS